MVSGSASSEDLARDRLQVRTELRDDVVIVHVVGEVDHTTSDILRRRCTAAMSAISSPRVVLDFDQVTYFDSSGLNALVDLWKAARARSGDLLLARSPGVCRRILQRTGLDRYITITPTIQRAMRSLGSQASPLRTVGMITAGRA